MANELTLFVNGAKQVVSAAPETPLLFVLRNELKLTGPRLGCGMAQCGACSVLLDGEEVRACITPISYAVGKQVTTIEGLPAVWAAEKSLNTADAAKTLHPIQQAWIDEQVPQCGYCQSGMMIAAVELLAKNLWLANCYFAHNSLEFPVLLGFCDARSGRPFHPFHRYPGSLAQT
jgi:isoquinoline 1-oxidoreductase alpha subunit